jgi:hypothetical protein
MLYLENLKNLKSDWQDDNSPSTMLTSHKMLKIATILVNRAFFIAVKIQPKLGNQGRFCPGGLHGQPILKFQNFFKFLQEGCSKDPCAVEQAPYLYHGLWHQGRNSFSVVPNFPPGQ